MKTKHEVHNLILLDESGSMESIKNAIIQGFNEIVQTVKGIAMQYPEQMHIISFYTFNGLGINELHFNMPIEKLELIDHKKYQPDASTPLYDAMGFSFAKLKKELMNKTNYNVLVTILTDGEENSSKEYTGKTIKKMVEDLSQKNWTFTYIGADHDVEKFATSISITNIMNFNKNEDDMKEMFVKENEARVNYSRKIRSNEDIIGNFYTDEKK
jgi:hypothetical protein